MRVRLNIYLERLDHDRSSYWAESPDVPGFYVVAEHLGELLTRSELALADILSEERPETSSPVKFKLVPVLIGEPPATEGASYVPDSPGAKLGQNRPAVRVRVA